MIKRLLPTKVARQSPLSAFSVLLIGQGFADQAEFELVVKQQFWPRLIDTPPFQDLDHPTQSNRLFVYYDPCQELDLKLQQNGNQLSVGMADKDALTKFVQTHTVQSDTASINCSQVWPKTLRTGRDGGFIAAIIKGSSPGELFQLDRSDNYPTPLIGVVATGNDWMMPIIRTIGALFAGLADEFSLPDQMILGEPFSRDKFPLNYLAPLPNLVPFTDEQRLLLLASKPWREVLGCLPPAFKATEKTTLKFITFEKNLTGSDTGINLFEGGATFRRNVARGSKDCIMRRQPLAAGVDPIQARVDFCPVCRNAIQGAMRGDPDFDLARAKRVTIDSQKSVYDMVNWGNTVQRSTGTLPAKQLVASKVKPSWSFTVQADAGVGVQIKQLQLLDRDGDPFKEAKDVLQEIDFGDLSVTWDGDVNATLLDWSNAFSNSDHPPRIEMAGPDPGGLYQLGFKITLTWDFPEKRPVEVAVSFVLRGQKNDFDPGAAALACKFYPQIAMRVLHPFKRSSGTKRPKATALRGSIVCVCNNIIPKSISAPGLEEFSTGTVQGSFFTDSNSTGFDNDYDMSENRPAEFVAKKLNVEIPYFGLWNAAYFRGRLMAGVGDSRAPFGIDLVGSTAYHGYRQKTGPLLPHWSWLFDYAAPALKLEQLKQMARAPMELKAATYAVGETTLDGNHKGHLPRQTVIPWPSNSKFMMTIQKEGRQGQYDNIHIHAAMPPMQGMSGELVPAPFCADMCMHLHWRWGKDAVSSMAAPYAFLGWGQSGRGTEGAHTSLGAPLIPPNQHLRVVGDPSSDQTSFRLTYDVTALTPGISEWQVFMEQGMAIAFRYAIGDLTEFCSALNSVTFGYLLAALRVLDQGPHAPEEETKSLLGLKSDPVKLDAAIRRRFHDIYSKIRFYDMKLDGFSSEQIPTYNSILEQF
jgi:hypothetical protein